MFIMTGVFVIFHFIIIMIEIKSNIRHLPGGVSHVTLYNVYGININILDLFLTVFLSRCSLQRRHNSGSNNNTYPKKFWVHNTRNLWNTFTNVSYFCRVKLTIWQGYAVGSNSFPYRYLWRIFVSNWSPAV